MLFDDCVCMCVPVFSEGDDVNAVFNAFEFLSKEDSDDDDDDDEDDEEGEEGEEGWPTDLTSSPGVSQLNHCRYCNDLNNWIITSMLRLVVEQH